MLCGAADEVLAVLKNDRMREKEKKKECESLLGTIAEERFALLLNLGKKITDWVQEEKMQTGTFFYFISFLFYYFQQFFLHFWTPTCHSNLAKSK